MLAVEEAEQLERENGRLVYESARNSLDVRLEDNIRPTSHRGSILSFAEADYQRRFSIANRHKLAVS